MSAASKGGTRGGGREAVQQRYNVVLIAIFVIFFLALAGIAVANATGLV